MNKEGTWGRAAEVLEGSLELSKFPVAWLPLLKPGSMSVNSVKKINYYP